MLDGSVVAPLEHANSLKELVAEGDVAARSVQISGFSGAGGVWGFHPDFVTIPGAMTEAFWAPGARPLRG